MNRYVILTYSTIPKNKKTTHIKGWKDQPNATQYNESISFKNKVKTIDLQTAKLILDTQNKTVYKNSLDTEIVYDQAINYLKKHYPKYFQTV
jgi:hypothetical protein|tara:strand:+ start:288 stop:563 length:276 start_codon:yes stop_codon:yes gene_type:complete